MGETTNENSVQMPTYKCHKEVWALKIKEAVENPNGSVDLFFELGQYAPVNILSPDSVRFPKNVEDLGYYVVYEDGYQSWSPTKAFESGYTRISRDD